MASARFSLNANRTSRHWCAHMLGKCASSLCLTQIVWTLPSCLTQSSSMLDLYDTYNSASLKTRHVSSSMWVALINNTNYISLPDHSLIVRDYTISGDNFGVTCPHLQPCPQVSASVGPCHPESVHTTWNARPIGMTLLHENQHCHRFPRGRSISCLAIRLVQK